MGNLLALDSTLPPDHPYHQACGLKQGGGDSLVRQSACGRCPHRRKTRFCRASSTPCPPPLHQQISVEYTSYPPSHDSGGRAPPGRAHSAVFAQLSELRLVFLYRFLQEVLQASGAEPGLG